MCMWQNFHVFYFCVEYQLKIPFKQNFPFVFYVKALSSYFFLFNFNSSIFPSVHKKVSNYIKLDDFFLFLQNTFGYNMKIGKNNLNLFY